MGQLKDLFGHARPAVLLLMVTQFIFTLTLLENPFCWISLEIFLILNIFIYPSSSFVNNYYDKDEGPVAGDSKLPPVSETLYWAALIFDTCGTLWAFFRVSPYFALWCISYAACIRLYSHPVPRLKKRPFGQLIFWNIVEGYYSTIAFYMAISGQFPPLQVHVAGAIYTLFLMGLWPIFQVFQHEEDEKRGDLTLSRILGIKGTLIFTFVVLSFAALAQYIYFFVFLQEKAMALTLIYGCISLPIIAKLIGWCKLVWEDERNADYENTMSFLWLATFTSQAFYVGQLANNSLGII